MNQIRYIDLYVTDGKKATRFVHFSNVDAFTIKTYDVSDYSKELTSVDVAEDYFRGMLSGMLGCPAGI